MRAAHSGAGSGSPVGVEPSWSQGPDTAQGSASNMAGRWHETPVSCRVDGVQGCFRVPTAWWLLPRPTPGERARWKPQHAHGPAAEVTCVHFCHVSSGYTGQPYSVWRVHKDWPPSWGWSPSLAGQWSQDGATADMPPARSWGCSGGDALLLSCLLWGSYPCPSVPPPQHLAPMSEGPVHTLSSAPGRLLCLVPLW